MKKIIVCTSIIIFIFIIGYLASNYRNTYTNNSITKEKAIGIVSNYPEVKNFLERMEKAKAKTIIDANEQTNKKNKIWLVQVAESYPRPHCHF